MVKRASIVVMVRILPAQSSGHKSLLLLMSSFPGPGKKCRNLGFAAKGFKYHPKSAHWVLQGCQEKGCHAPGGAHILSLGGCQWYGETFRSFRTLPCSGIECWN